MLIARRRVDWLQILVGMGALALVPFLLPLQAQETDSSDADEAELEEEEVQETDEPEVADQGREEVLVVTGSRLVRDEYTSIAPLQIIDSETSREAGLIDAADVIQESTQASGEQIDLTFNGYVLDDGPGASTANLRGLGADRTLILINGRRLAPAGVEGAPSNPDLNLLMPGSLVQRYEVLADGASAVYGSDAIAGVVNVILREDFDGFEFDVFYDLNQHSKIGSTTYTMSWGYNFDRGFMGFGSSVQDVPETTLDDVAFRSNCDRHVERDQSGAIRQKDMFFPTVYKMRWDDCRLGLITSRVSMGAPLYSIYPTPGFTNVGIPGWSDSTYPVPVGIHVLDGDGDGYADFSFRDFDLNGRTGHRSYYPEVKRNNFMAYGEYTMLGDLNLTPFFEVQWARRAIFADSGEPQLFPDVPANNPFNFCNPQAEGGIDCIQTLIDGSAAIFSLPEVREAFLSRWSFLDPIPGGSCDQFFAPFGLTCAEWWLAPVGWYPGMPLQMVPIVSVNGDRNTVDTEVTQSRYVVGASLNLPFMDGIGSLNGWSGQVEAVITRSLGKSSRLGIRGDRLNYALGWYNAAGIPCLADATAPIGFQTRYELTPDVTDGCVPVDMFDPGLYRVGAGVVGDFATKAERDYLFDSRDFDTEINQSLVTAFMSGAMFDLPNGTVIGSYGFEWREDEIVSLPDDVARDGLFFGFFVDYGATGVRTITEHFSEMEFPIFDGGFMRHELIVNLSARNTTDEFFDTQNTWSAKIGWRPNSDWFIRATSGTSFRTPNLRNLFLEGQTGFLTASDPCLIPDDALDPDGNYIEDNDLRDPEIMANCLAAGVDPTRAHNWGFNAYSVEVSTGGAADSLLPENSTSSSIGVVWEQPFTNAFDLYLSWTYYEIEVEDTIISPSLGFILYDCYGFRPGDPTFCDRIAREDDPGTEHYDPLITLVDVSFINRDVERTRGFDFNMRYSQQIEIFDKPIELNIDAVSHRLLERYSLFLESSEDPVEYFSHGDWGYHRWKHSINAGARMYDMLFRWSTRILSPMSHDPEFEDLWSDAQLGGSADTCLGPPDDLLCRDVEDTGRYLLHSLSVNYYGGGGMGLGVGVYNVFNTEPPLIDTAGGVTTLGNRPLGYGYDLTGRSYFLSFTYILAGG